jgi:hypothetical protein
MRHRISLWFVLGAAGVSLLAAVGFSLLINAV